MRKIKDYPASHREKASMFRRQGYSYGMISERLGVSKSTLSGWLKDVEYLEVHPEVIERAGRGRARGGHRNHLKRLREKSEMTRQAKAELGNISGRDLWLGGVALYWGEGTKSDEEVGISNCDPGVIGFMMRWFRQVCKVSEEDFKLEVHLYPDNEIQESISYWSGVSGVRVSQFYEPRVDRRDDKRQKKKNLLPHGTLRIRIHDKRLHRRIMGWIDALSIGGSNSVVE